MKILLLADPSSSHTIKWVNSLCERGFEVFVFGLSDFPKNVYDKNARVIIWKAPYNIKNLKDGNLLKIIYLSAFPQLKKLIKRFKPDIIHAHYASSYGLLGALCSYHPYFLSVWGNDVFDFPKKSAIHKNVLSYVLNKADIILSTSKIMAEETRKYTRKLIEIIPFGVDTEKFRPQKVDSLFAMNDIVIGTIKSLYPTYGIEYLIRAFGILKNDFTLFPLKLLIVGGGELEEKLKKLVCELDIENDTTFTGRVPYTEVIKYHNMLTISIFPSVNESFGVSVLEASACEKPVIVTRVGGFQEVVRNGVTGIIVEPESPESLASAIKLLIRNPNRIQEFGKAGREMVIKYFQWSKCVDQMEQFYITYKREKTCVESSQHSL